MNSCSFKFKWRIGGNVADASGTNRGTLGGSRGLRTEGAGSAEEEAVDFVVEEAVEAVDAASSRIQAPIRRNLRSSGIPGPQIKASSPGGQRGIPMMFRSAQSAKSGRDDESICRHSLKTAGH
jgi:hypothetical protein